MFGLFHRNVVTGVSVLARRVVRVARFVVGLVIPTFTNMIIGGFGCTVFVEIFSVISATGAFRVPSGLQMLPNANKRNMAHPTFTLGSFFIGLHAIVDVCALRTGDFFFVHTRFIISCRIRRRHGIVAFRDIGNNRRLYFVTVFDESTTFLVGLTWVGWVVKIMTSQVPTQYTFVNKQRPSRVSAGVVGAINTLNRFEPRLATFQMVPIGALWRHKVARSSAPFGKGVEDMTMVKLFTDR